ncbi:MAG: DUF4184 family protein [Actinomycetales bacterium]|nr:DUF4184 family protein [Actinomycetales bacterium]
MPLTFAHPAAVLPLMRGPLVPLALVAGALAPDVPYFLRALRIPVSAQSWWEPFVNATTTHSWLGALTAAAPLAVVLYLAFAFCERPARWALPATGPVARRARGPLWLVWVVVSLVLGLLTHVAWDMLTESNRLHQHLSTAVGLVVLVVVGWRQRGRWLTSSDPARRTRFLRVMAAFIGAVAVGVVLVTVVRHEAGDGAERLLSSAALGAGLGAAVAAVGLTVAWWVVRPGEDSGSTPG